jgi:hypothetical protein
VEFVLLGLVLLAVPLFLPLALWVALYRTRTRLTLLEQTVDEQKDAIARLNAQVIHLKDAAIARPQEAATGGVAVRPAAAPPPAPPAPLPAPVVARPAAVPPAPRPVPVTPPVAAPPATSPASVAPAAAPGTPGQAPATLPAPVSSPAAAAPVAPAARVAGAPPVTPPRVPPRVPPPPPEPPAPSFDWESLVGVKLFSAIAGIALVIAAVSFLRYSMQQGWLQPPVRVLIGVAVAIALLIVCELKAARRYPVTANALDAASVAILFATFFAAHSLWNLIPAPVAFALLAVVTAIAVLLSIRHESLFIAVLGLLGGFATPALLSTGENRPIPLFAYLVLLNVGLAWVAYKKVWPSLTILSVILTTIYQWGWADRFLTGSELPTGLGIFVLFPVVSMAALLFGRRNRAVSGDAEVRFAQSTAMSATLPLAFAAYLAAVPEYGAQPALLFGFLLLIAAGLFAVSIALDRMVLHLFGAMATVVVWAVWLSRSYSDASRGVAIGFVAAFVALYLLVPAVARRLSRSMADGERAIYAAPALLFVFAVIGYSYPPDVTPWALFGPLCALVVLCAWRAIAEEEGGLFFTASFLAVTAEAVWSAHHLTSGRLSAAVGIYALFGIVTTAAPFVARRCGRPFRPAAGAGIVLLASLGLLIFLSAGPIAPVALWSLALLLAILNAGLFIESAGERMPVISQIGSIVSWAILASWWYRTAAVVGVLPSLAVVTGLALITLAGHAWVSFKAGTRATASRPLTGTVLGLLGHAFLFFVAMNREWSVPPGPLFGSLAVVTLAASVTAMVAREWLLHVLGTAAAGLVVTAFASASGWHTTALLASAAVSIYALAWIAIGARARSLDDTRRGAAAALFVSELTALAVAMHGSSVPFVGLLILHVMNVAVLLALSTQARWQWVSSGALAVAWLAVAQWQLAHASEWIRLLMLAGALYAVFSAYALIAGPREPGRREPWMVALGAAAMAFFAGRDAFVTGKLQWMIGVVPVILGAVTAILLRTLLRLESAGRRDMTRLALVAGAALALATVAIPLQLHHQWITIGWALEGVALAWLYRRVPHRGLLIAATALLVVVFVRLGLNPSIFAYEPRGTLRIVNWYLYTYAVAAAAMFAAAWYLNPADDRPAPWLPRTSRLLPALATILLFLLLNIEIADFYAIGPSITFRYGLGVSQDLTYTIGWLGFGMILLSAGIYLQNRPARIAAVSLIAVTTFKCFLYDLSSLGGLYRVASFVGLAIALALVSLALQKFVLARPGTAS